MTKEKMGELCNQYGNADIGINWESDHNYGIRQRVKRELEAEGLHISWDGPRANLLIWQGTDIVYDWWADKDYWDKARAEYDKRHGIIRG